MAKLFVIPGFKHRISDPTYRWFKKDLGEKFDIELVDIDWNRKVMSDYVQQFVEVYEEKKSKKNIVLGFSFGSMIALLSAGKLEPDELFLCSLSPYFKEDLSSLKDWWKKYVGKRRIEDFKTLSAKRAARDVKTQTTIFLGGRESEKFPSLKKRCESTAKDLGAELLVVPDAPHDIACPTYRELIVRTLKRA